MLHSVAAFLASLIFTTAFAAGTGTITPLDQFRATTTPWSALTTTVYGKKLYFPSSWATTTGLTATTICLTGDSCRTTWPSGGGGSGFSTTSSDYWLTQKSTTNLLEGSNLYYTDARVGSYISGSSTVPHIGGSAYGDMLSWTGSAWATRATSTLGISTSDVFEGTKLFFTNARAIASTLTGYTSGAGTVSASDTILGAIQKLNGNIAGLVTGVSSVFGRTGAVTAQSGDYNTSQVTESGNLYYTDVRARGALSATYPLQYNSGIGIFSVAYGTTTPNTWAALQTFGAISATSSAITNASSTALTASGTAYFGTASTSNLTISNLTGTQCLHEIAGVVSGTGSDCGSGGAGVSSLAASYPLLTTGATGAVTLSLAYGTTTPNTWAALQTFGAISATSSTITYSSSTAETVSGTSYAGTASTTNLIVSSIKSALPLAAVNGTMSAYTGSSCGSNTFASSVNGAGVLTCTNIPNAALANSTIGATSPNSTLSIGTAASLGSTFTADLNLGNSNWWTARQNFSNASTSQFTATSSAWFTSLGTPAGTFLAVDPNGLLIATTTPAGGSTSFANPTASLGTAAVNGSASTAMRSDAAPAIDQTMAPTWTGTHTFNTSPTFGTKTNGILLGGNTWVYASSTNQDVILGIGSGGNAATTTATVGANVAIGYNTLKVVNSGAFGVRDTAIGAFAAGALSSGADDVFVGNSAAPSMVSQNKSIVIGSQALTNYGGGAGGSNIFVGYQVGNSITGGSNNVILSACSCTSPTLSITSGSNNIVIGAPDESLPSATLSGQMNIGGILFGKGNSTTQLTPGAGTIGVGTTSPFARFSISANSGDTNTNLFLLSSSTATATTTLHLIDNMGRTAIATSTYPALDALFSVGSSTRAAVAEATTTIFLDSASKKGTCIVMKDADGTGYSYLQVNNGVLSVTTASCQ